MQLQTKILTSVKSFKETSLVSLYNVDIIDFKDPDTGVLGAMPIEKIKMRKTNKKKTKQKIQNRKIRADKNREQTKRTEKRKQYKKITEKIRILSLRGLTI